MITRSNRISANKFCSEPIESIPGYAKAKSSTERYCIHHILGLDSKKEYLISNGMYYKRPAIELVFITVSEHRSLHTTGKSNPNYGNHNKRPIITQKLKGNYTGEKAYWYGKKRSEETKRKIIETKTERGNLLMFCKRVYQYDLNGVFIESYESTMDVHRKLGFDSSSISKCCLGKLKTSKGYIWSYEPPSKIIQCELW